MESYYLYNNSDILMYCLKMKNTSIKSVDLQDELVLSDKEGLKERKLI